MITHIKEDGEICECKHSYCKYGVEICSVCGRRDEKVNSQLLNLPYGTKQYEPNARLFGYDFREAQGYKGYGIIQKY